MTGHPPTRETAARTRVCAAVVTHNRRELLVECLAALLAQTYPLETIVVVDNASTDGTPELLHERGLLVRDEVRLLRLGENRGGAGGFAAAVDATRAEDCDWIWLMDDDSEPRPDALERLLGAPPAAQAATVALCPKVVYATGGIDANQRGHFHRRLRPLPAGEYRDGHHPSLGFLSFVGALVRTSAAWAADLPRADFFVWGDDVEYSFRLRRLPWIVRFARQGRRGEFHTIPPARWVDMVRAGEV